MVGNVFVYGTLQPGHSNHAWIRDHVIAMRPAEVHGFRMFGKNERFPCVQATDDEENDIVHGWVILVKDIDLALEHLDILEGHPVLFERQKTTAILGEDQTKEAWIYVGRYDYPGEWIQNGVWSE